MHFERPHNFILTLMNTIREQTGADDWLAENGNDCIKHYKEHRATRISFCTVSEREAALTSCFAKMIVNGPVAFRFAQLVRTLRPIVDPTYLYTLHC